MSQFKIQIGLSRLSKGTAFIYIIYGLKGVLAYRIVLKYTGFTNYVDF